MIETIVLCLSGIVAFTGACYYLHHLFDLLERITDAVEIIAYGEENDAVLHPKLNLTTNPTKGAK